MGACSSKPKTADFEGGLGLQEENLQEAALRKNLEAEDSGWEGIERQQEVCELSIQTLAIQTKGHDETQDVPALLEMQVIKGLKEETMVLQDDCQRVKHVQEETMNDSGAEKELPRNQELVELQITPENIVSESSGGHDDSVFIIDFTKELQEDMRHLAAHDTETVIAQHKHLILSNGNLENEDILTLSNGNLENGVKGIENGSFSDSNTPSLQDAPNVELMVRAASDDVLDLESEKEVLKDFTKPIEEDMITGEACKEAGEDFIIGASNNTKSPVAEASGQVSLKETANTGDGHLAIITGAITVISQHVLYEKTKEQEAGVNGAASKSAESFVKILAEPDRAPIEDKMAVKDVILLADSHLMNDVPVKESSVESLDTVDGEGECVCGKNCFNDKHLSQPVVVGEESSHLKLEASGEDAQENKPCAATLDLKGQQKSDGTSFPNGVTAFQVIATAKKPEALSVCAMEFTELAFIPAQDISGPDIDEVLEKLASEFERQERVACATP